MDPVSSATAAASNAVPGSVQGSAAVMVLKKAIDSQASSAAQLIAALPQPALATSGTLGTQLNRYA